ADADHEHGRARNGEVVADRGAALNFGHAPASGFGIQHAHGLGVVESDLLEQVESAVVVREPGVIEDTRAGGQVDVAAGIDSEVQDLVVVELYPEERA